MTYGYVYEDCRGHPGARPYATTRTPPCRAQPWDGMCFDLTHKIHTCTQVQVCPPRTNWLDSWLDGLGRSGGMERKLQHVMYVLPTSSDAMELGSGWNTLRDTRKISKWNDAADTGARGGGGRPHTHRHTDRPTHRHALTRTRRKTTSARAMNEPINRSGHLALVCGLFAPRGRRIHGSGAV